MVAYNKFNQTVEDMMHAVHDFETDQLVVALTDTAPVATNSILANITEISYTNLSSRNLTTATSEGSDGSYELVVNDLVLTSSGGNTGPFRYIVIYNDTPTSPADPLICWFDRGSSLTLLDTETLTLDFGANLFTLV